MKSHEIRELMAQIESEEIPRNLSPSESDRAQIRSRKHLALAVLEVALQLADIVEDGFPGLENAMHGVPRT